MLMLNEKQRCYFIVIVYRTKTKIIVTGQSEHGRAALMPKPLGDTPHFR